MSKIENFQSNLWEDKMKKKIAICLILLLLLYPIFAETFSEMYSIENRTTFSTKGHPKAKGINLTLKYPSFWESLEGDRPNIVQKFRYYDDEVLVTSMILILEPFDTQESDKAIANDLFQKDNLESLLPDMYSFIDGDLTTYDNLKGCWITAAFEQSMAGEVVSGYTLFQVFVYKRRLIMINSSITTGDYERDIECFTKFLPEFQIIGASIILPDQWK